MFRQTRKNRFGFTHVSYLGIASGARVITRVIHAEMSVGLPTCWKSFSFCEGVREFLGSFVGKDIKAAPVGWQSQIPSRDRNPRKPLRARVDFANSFQLCESISEPPACLNFLPGPATSGHSFTLHEKLIFLNARSGTCQNLMTVDLRTFFQRSENGGSNP